MNDKKASVPNNSQWVMLAAVHCRTLLLISISSARLMFTRGGGDRHSSQVICEIEVILCPIELNISFVLV